MLMEELDVQMMGQRERDRDRDRERCAGGTRIYRCTDGGIEIDVQTGG